jgi:hypothetical protein
MRKWDGIAKWQCQTFGSISLVAVHFVFVTNQFIKHLIYLSFLTSVREMV